MSNLCAIHSFSGELSRLAWLSPLVLCLSLASCDQYISIAVIDATTASNTDNLSPESPETSSGFIDGADASVIPSNPPFADDDETLSDAGTEAGIPPVEADATVLPLNPPITDNADASDGSAVDDRPVVEGCDPTKEGVCEGVLQCVVDQTVFYPKGVCVFYTPIDVICFGSFFTESCPETFMCWGGSCRELCLCNSDCSEGRCCGEAVGPGGFKLCANC